MSNPFLTVLWKWQGSPRVKGTAFQEDRVVHQVPKAPLALAQPALLSARKEGSSKLCAYGPQHSPSPQLSGVVRGLFHHLEYSLIVLGTAAPSGENKNPKLI